MYKLIFCFFFRKVSPEGSSSLSLMHRVPLPPGLSFDPIDAAVPRPEIFEVARGIPCFKLVSFAKSPVPPILTSLTNRRTLTKSAKNHFSSHSGVLFQPKRERSAAPNVPLSAGYWVYTCVWRLCHPLRRFVQRCRHSKATRGWAVYSNSKRFSGSKRKARN